jgi:hypothetical protein
MRTLMIIIFIIGTTLSLSGLYLILSGGKPDDIYYLLNAYKTTGVGLLFIIPSLIYFILSFRTHGNGK